MDPSCNQGLNQNANKAGGDNPGPAIAIVLVLLFLGTGVGFAYYRKREGKDIIPRGIIPAGWFGGGGGMNQSLTRTSNIGDTSGTAPLGTAPLGSININPEVGSYSAPIVADTAPISVNDVITSPLPTAPAATRYNERLERARKSSPGKKAKSTNMVTVEAGAAEGVTDAASAQSEL